MSDSILCDRCNGKGNILIKNSDVMKRMRRCEKCQGMGTINWIEKIFGRTKPLTVDERLERYEIEDKFEEEFFKKNMRIIGI